MPVSWTTLEGRTIIREIIEAEVPQWQNGPRDTQVEVWSYAMARESTILVASIGWGKTAAFFGPIIVMHHLLKHPRPRIPSPPRSPVALIVTPLVELGNAHVGGYRILGNLSNST